MCVEVSDNVFGYCLYDMDLVVWYMQFYVVGLQCCGEIVVEYVEDYYVVDMCQWCIFQMNQFVVVLLFGMNVKKL